MQVAMITMVILTKSQTIPFQRFNVPGKIDIEYAQETLKEKNTCLEIPSLYSKRAILEVKNNVRENKILLHVDFAESYQNTHQYETQSAYFGNKNSSIFTVCCYVCHSRLKTLDHTRIARYSLVLKVVNKIKQIYPHPSHDTTIHLWSDGCASQFKSRYVLLLKIFSRRILKL